MGRDYLFRAWIKNDKIMVYADNKVHDYCMVCNGNGFGVVYQDTEWLKDDEFEIMQFVGIQDKNKKDIYESDFVRGRRGDIILIKWVNTGFMPFRSMDGGKTYTKQTNWDSVRHGEIIGNIHEMGVEGE